MTVSLSGLIKLGFQDVCSYSAAGQRYREAQCREPALRGVCVKELAKLVQRREVPACRQDDLLAASIRAYRNGPAAMWGPILLNMLGPALVRMAARLYAQPPAVDGEDIDQEVVVEALRAAALMPLPDGCRFVQRRLIRFTTKRLTRGLARERRRQASQASWEVMREELQ